MWSDLLSVVLVIAGLAAVGYPLRAALRRFHVPPAVSLMALGTLAGPAGLALLPEGYSAHATTLSKAAFVVLLLRAGLGLAPGVMRRVLGPAMVFGLVPPALELAALCGLSRAFLFDDWGLAILAGFLVAAVSPAVILPTMLNQKDAGRGGPRSVPDRIIGQTVVNAFVAQTGILFMIEVLAPAPGAGAPETRFLMLPVALLGGLALGISAGWLLRLEKVVGAADANPPVPRLWTAVALLLATGLAVYFSCAALRLESVFATLAVGALVRPRVVHYEPVLRASLKEVWGLAEIILFANLGAAIDLQRLTDVGLLVTLLAIFAAALGVRLLAASWLARGTDLDAGERRYVTFANIPKATIQAVFGALPLATFTLHRPELVPEGQTLLIMAALAIVATAPVGAVLLERLGERCLRPDTEAA